MLPLNRFYMIDNFKTSNEVKDSTQIALCSRLTPEKFAELRKKGKVDLRRKSVEPPYTIKIDGIGALPRKDIFAIKAKSKQGKSQAATILLAGALGCETLGITRAEATKAKVVYFDTEQADYNTLRIGHRINHLMGWELESSNARLRVYNMREWAWEDKLPFIAQEIGDYRPTMVVIDGIADLLVNFNDIEESARTILDLMQIASKFRCSIGCVLHENKAKEDNNMKGHLGTLLLQKASDIFEITKKGDIFTLKQTESRNKPVNDISWRMDDLGYIHRQDKDPQQVAKEVSEAKAATWRQIFARLNVNEARYKDLVQAYMDVEGLKATQAKTAIKKALEEGYIGKTEEGLYTHILGRRSV